MPGRALTSLTPSGGSLPTSDSNPNLMSRQSCPKEKECRVAEFVAAARKVEVLKTLEDGTTLKTAITWTGMNLFENTVTVTVFYKNTPQVATFGWNVQNP